MRKGKEKMTTPGPRILALDLMTALGWAVRADDGTPAYGTETFKVHASEGAGMRWLRFRNWLKRMRDETQFNAVYYEECVGFPPKNKGQDARVYHSFSSNLTAFCEERAIPYAGVGVGTIKRFITGKGNSPKSAVIEAVKRLGYHPADSNQADALALLLYAEQDFE